MTAVQGPACAAGIPPATTRPPPIHPPTCLLSTVQRLMGTLIVGPRLGALTPPLFNPPLSNPPCSLLPLQRSWARSSWVPAWGALTTSGASPASLRPPTRPSR